MEESAGSVPAASPQPARRRSRSGGGKHRKSVRPAFPAKKPTRSTLEFEEVQELQNRIARETPARGSNPAVELAGQPFARVPLSRLTSSGLEKAGYSNMTEIQASAIPHALAGRDILGAAKTGSGKTLAFLIPILEKLFRERWTREDGLGALIISPTRELALQIFDVLRKVGVMHEFSAGLVIGGKDLGAEKQRISLMNILVGTPGRILQHLETTAGIQVDNLQVLVLDEADRILDMGFERQLNAILDQLPKQRQSLLFSATQTKSIRDLARLSLRHPEYLAVHENATVATPTKLVQFYMKCKLTEKFDLLFSFLRSHLKTKVIVFFATCKQAKFAYETFCHIRPGISLLLLTSKLKPMKRLSTFYRYCESNASALFATDVASRGLDFPAVDWVIQFDCPEDVDTYIHRVGRTARFERGGKSLSFFTEQECPGMLAQLEKRKIPLKTLAVNPEKKLSIQNKLSSVLSADPDLKYLAQKAFISYMRFLYVQKNKEIFDWTKVALQEFAESLGLVNVPNLNFSEVLKSKYSDDKNLTTSLTRTDKKKAVSAAAKGDRSASADSDEESGPGETDAPVRQKTRIERILQKQSAGVLSQHYMDAGAKDGGAFVGNKATAGSGGKAEEDSSDEGDEFLHPKNRKAGDGSQKGNDEGEDDDETVKRALAKQEKKARRKIQLNADVSEKKIVFDEEGNAVQGLEAIAEAVAREKSLNQKSAADLHSEIQERMAKVAKLMKERDLEDKQVQKTLRKEKRWEKKQKERERASGGSGGGAIVTLGSADASDSDDDGDDNDDDDEYGDTHGSDSDNAMHDDDDGDDEDEDDHNVRTSTSGKRRAPSSEGVSPAAKRVRKPETVEDEEALAMRLLGMA